MSENICSICYEKFEDGYFDKEQSKCIFHCEKNRWNDELIKNFWIILQKNLKHFIVNDTKIEFNHIVFPKFEDDIKLNILCKETNSKDKLIDTANKFIFFNHCTFLDKFEFNFIESSGSLIFDKYCKFKSEQSFEKEKINFEIIFKKTEFENGLFFKEVEFEKKISFYDCKIKSVGFLDCIFYKKFYFDINDRKVINNFNLRFCTFDERVTFIGNKINSLELINNFFNSNISLIALKINSINFINNSFAFNLNFNNIANLDSIKLKSNNVANRETARTIKNSFEQQNNIIEANKFYAIEMQKMEEELKKADKVKISEWLIFKIHGLTSNHSQDWLLALFWILSLSFGLAFVNCVNEYLDTKLEYMIIDTLVYFLIIILSIFIVQKEKINNFYLIGLFYLIYGFTTKDFTLYNIVNNINPFSIMTEFSELTLLTLVYKVTIAYLIYQLIISIRQNTRRK
ncbi:hypothetical protein CRV01_07785 [Arcobacter sp. CECT 8983]|uniref:hypothetical protein n=1 Tax=Arcobacter sp. CECT 8983 TaxID=2044508 RepID=UPI00100C1CCB|nr:hypothetical protein [Arcobacter sp. CECT 8983]RXJ89762.1 hypothetical protein CRV01_07785 [Arcobacter sp. CECT 8983]